MRCKLRLRRLVPIIVVSCGGFYIENVSFKVRNSFCFLKMCMFILDVKSFGWISLSFAIKLCEFWLLLYDGLKNPPRWTCSAPQRQHYILYDIKRPSYKFKVGRRRWKSLERMSIVAAWIVSRHSCRRYYCTRSNIRHPSWKFTNMYLYIVQCVPCRGEKFCCGEKACTMMFWWTLCKVLRASHYL